MDAVVQLRGNVGTEVDFRKPEGELDAWSTFRLATTPSFRRGEEWIDLPTTWLTVNCRRGLAWNVRRSVVKGDAVVVVGKLRTRTWQDAETKQMREQLVIEAEVVGHDLNHGVSNFLRPSRTKDEVELERGGSDPWLAPSATTDEPTATEELAAV